MRRKNTLFLLLLFCLLSQITYSQEKGNISGRVKDDKTGDWLPGASVSIPGTSIGAVTNLNGEFLIQGISPGSKKLEIRSIGYSSKTITASVEPGKTTNLQILLSLSASTLSSVVVVGSAEGQRKALNQQKNADNIKNIISADLIGRFPDLNVAEALQRVPGVNIARDKGEGSSISLRGTPDFYTHIKINGEQIVSAQESGSRAEGLDLIPADQLASMEITKAPTPDLDGDAIGGSVNLITPTAKSTKLRLNTDLAGGYNNLAENLNAIGKLRIDKRFLATEDAKDGRLGVMLSGSYYQTNNSEDRTDAVWEQRPITVTSLGRDTIVLQDYQFRKTENIRTRLGLTATVDYRFNKNSTLIFNYMYNQRTDDDLRNRLRYDFDRSDSRWQSLDTLLLGRIRRDINDWNEQKSNHNLNLEGRHVSGAWTLDWGAFYTLSRRELTSLRSDFARDGIDLVMGSSKGIYTEVPQIRTLNPLLDQHDPLLLNDFRRYENDFSSTDAYNAVGRINISRNLSIKNNPLLIKAGLKFREQGNSRFRNNIVYTYNDPNRVSAPQEAFGKVISDYEQSGFLNGLYRFGPKVDPDKFQNYLEANSFFLDATSNEWDSRRLSLNDTYEAREQIGAAYVMGRLQLKKLMILAGARVETNNVSYDAFDVKRQGTTVDATPIQGGNDYHFILPSLHLKYSLTNMTNLRMALYRNYARPNFTDLVPFVNYDADALTLFVGNTDLQPAVALNADLMYEHYFSNTGILSGGVFFKQIDQFQFERNIPRLETPYPGFPESANFRFSQQQNGETANVFGVEINAQINFDFLPGLLAGLGTYFNYTYTSSDAFTQDREGINLPGQAAHTGNAALSYDYKNFTVRGMLNYNGSYTVSLASDANNDVIQMERWQFDMNAAYQINPRFRLFMEWMNITNSPAKRYQGIPDRISRIAYFGWWNRFGIGYRF